MKRVIIAGASCGCSSMQRVSEKVDKYCQYKGIKVKVTVHNLWQSVHLDSRADLVIQMFPFFEELSCPVLDGRSFIKGDGEDELLNEVVKLLV